MVWYGDVHSKQFAVIKFFSGTEVISNEHTQMVKKCMLLTLLINALLVIGLHKSQILKKAKQSSVTHMVLVTVFRNAEGVILVDTMSHGQNINSYLCIQT